jgi:hypothetical protein
MGCVSKGEVKLQPSDGNELITNQKLSVFLFRLSAEIDRKPINMLNEFNENRIQISIANIDKEESLERVATVYSPAEVKGKDGWFYLLLEPSAYYMNITSIWQTKLDPILFYIPAGTSLVYGGSFSLSCKGGLSSIFECSNIQIEDETVIAELIAKEFLKEYLPISPFPAETFTDSIPESVKNDLLPVGFTTSITSEFDHPNWRSRVWNHAIGIDMWTGDPKESSPLKSYLRGSWYLGGEGGFLLGYWLYLAGAVPYAAVAGEVSQSVWSSCMDSFMAELSKADLQEEITLTIQNEIYGNANATSNEKFLTEPNPDRAKSLLQVSIIHIGLTECTIRGTYNPEISFYVKLWHVASKKLVFNKIFIFTSADRRTDTIKPYFSLIYGSECREMKSYCNDETQPVFKTEISNAINAVGQALVKEIGLLEKPIPPIEKD